MKHTPGPWYYSHEQGNAQGEYMNSLRRWRIDSEKRALMLTAEAWNTFTDDKHVWDEVEANVRLAATAPEMLEALKMVMASVPFFSYRGDGELEEVETAVRAAIAKAEGRS